MICSLDIPKGSRPNLAAERAKRRISIPEAAKMIGVHPNAWYRWENGLTCPDGRNLLKICKLFDADPEYLLEQEQ